MQLVIKGLLSLIYLILATGCDAMSASRCKERLLYDEQRSPVCLDDVYDSKKLDALANEIYRGDYQSVLTIVSTNRGLINEAGRYGITPLWLAVRFQHVDITNYLLQQGADPNSPVDRVHTILGHGVLGKPEILRSLIAHGADLKEVNAGPVVDMLPIHLAALSSEDDPTNIKILLEAGADPNAPRPGENSDTPLFSASVARNTSIMLALLEAGADPTVRSRGDTFLSALHETSFGRKYLEEEAETVFRWLREHGYNVDELLERRVE